MSSSSLLGVNITSPQKGQQIPANIVDLTISGKSTDKPAADDCQVSVIVNSIKPYQHTIANGSTGEKTIIQDGFLFSIQITLPSRKEQIKSQTSYHVFPLW